MWKLLLFSDKEGYLISASAPGEDEEVPGKASGSGGGAKIVKPY